MSDPVFEYAERVLTGDIPVCRYVKLACDRYLNDFDNPNFWYDADAAQKFFDFCSYLKHYKGPYRGKPIELELWQKFYFGNVYGWKRVIDGEKTGILRFHYNYLEVPRKNGKTTISAAGALYDALMLEETGCEVYCLATKEDQAKLLWNDCKTFIARSEELSQDFEVLAGRNTIFATKTDRTSFIKPLGSDSDKQDGLNPISAYADELHAWPKRDLWDVMEDAFGGRDNWHINTITTAGHNKFGICYTERKHLIDILEGRIEAEDKFGLIYTVEDDEKDQFKTENIWFKANPNLGTGKTLSFMESQCNKAVQIPSKLNSFLNKQLNIWTDAEEAWIPDEGWKLCVNTEVTWDDLLGKKCYLGMDLARVNDLSAVAAFFPEQDGVETPTLMVDFYIPEQDVRKRSETDRVPYDVWVRQGYIKTMPGKTTDFEFVKQHILKLAEKYNVLGVGYDRHFGGEIIQQLDKNGLDCIPFGMGFLSMGPASAEFERRVMEMQLQHGVNPVLDWNLSNTVIAKDPAGLIKPDKQKSIERIDGITASIVSLGIFMDSSLKPKSNPYKKRGLRVLTRYSEEKS